MLPVAVSAALGACPLLASGAEEHGLPQGAVEIARPFGLPVTNSMVVTWIVAAALIFFARIATRDMKGVPGGAQNFLEWLIEALYGFLEGIIGPHLVKRTFWFFATIFIFILSANWIGLVPGVGTIGWGHRTNQVKIDDYTFGPSRITVVAGTKVTFTNSGVTPHNANSSDGGGWDTGLLAKGETAGALKVLLTVVFFAAGCLEVVSILFRPVSLSFRLYGNVFAGENMLETMATLVPGFGWLLPIPFYFLELLVGLVQALVFMLLTAVFTLLICQHEEPSAAGSHVES